MKNLFFLILFCCVVSCQSNNSEGGEYDTMAKDLCKCMRPLADMNTKVKRLMRQNKMAEVQALFSQLEKLAEEGESCTEDLEIKYGVIEGEKEEKANKAMQNHCPDIAQMIEDSKNMEMR